MNKSLLLALPLLVAAPLLAHDGSHAAPACSQKGPGCSKKMVDVSKISGGTYTVESTHALIQWRVSHVGINDYFGIFGNPTGTLVLDKANPAKSSVTIEVPIKELYTASAKLTGHMMSKDFFNAEVHPTAKFVSTHVIPRGQMATIHGNLTLLGVTKPITLEAKLSGVGKMQKEQVGFHAKGKINRADFGMTFGAQFVPDPVELDISIAFEK